MTSKVVFELVLVGKDGLVIETGFRIFDMKSLLLVDTLHKCKCLGLWSRSAYRLRVLATSDFVRDHLQTLSDFVRLDGEQIIKIKVDKDGRMLYPVFWKENGRYGLTTAIVVLLSKSH